MKANELRIGNWVDFDKEEIAIDLEYFYWEIEGNGVLQHTKPIPLTEEWLLKFGFVKRYEDCFEYGEFILNDEFIMMDIDITVKCKHVHQLQNLYHALKGEELTIKQNDEK